MEPLWVTWFISVKDLIKRKLGQFLHFATRKLRVHWLDSICIQYLMNTFILHFQSHHWLLGLPRSPNEVSCINLLYVDVWSKFPFLWIILKGITSTCKYSMPMKMIWVVTIQLQWWLKLNILPGFFQCHSLWNIELSNKRLILHELDSHPDIKLMSWSLTSKYCIFLHLAIFTGNTDFFKKLIFAPRRVFESNIFVCQMYG